MSSAEDWFQKGNFSQAVFEATAAVRLGGGIRAYLMLGKANLEDEAPEEAVEAYTRALELEPRNAAALAGLSRARAALPRAK